jgi:predicted ATP-grasp superfamily ATP-dependent carboligase
MALFALASELTLPSTDSGAFAEPKRGGRPSDGRPVVAVIASSNARSNLGRTRT